MDEAAEDLRDSCGRGSLEALLLLQMWTNARATTAASMAARTSLEATGAAARRATSSTTSGTSV